MSTRLPSNSWSKQTPQRPPQKRFMLLMARVKSISRHSFRRKYREFYPKLLRETDRITKKV
jgi:hypothetical protein